MKLPASVREIAAVIGQDKALYLVGQLPTCVSKKSTHVILYVPTPSRLKPDHRLVQILGWRDALKMCNAFGGEIMQPANCASYYKSFRDRSIHRLATEEKLPLQSIATMFEISDRQVRNIVKEISQQASAA